ncbi:MAG: hypothetical protein ACD_46C00599G0003 [uncultured bacterium]|nr:MAG: hypothetical protein ACD_46C00599G0003 [uncultured bacterium]
MINRDANSQTKSDKTTQTDTYYPGLSTNYDNELFLEHVIIKSKLNDTDTQKQSENILREFNKKAIASHVSAFTTSYFRGDWIDRDEFLLAHRNKTPELSAFNGSYNIARDLNPFNFSVVTEVTGKYKINDLFYGQHGSYVLNIPVEKYAKAWSGNLPLIFGPGPHVVHDVNFKFAPSIGLIDQNTPYVNHGTIHILRVPAGSIAKVWVGTVPYFLEARAEPYVFNDPLFRLERKNGNELFFSATEALIQHGSKKRLIPKTGEVAITYNNGKLEIIEPKIDSNPTIIDSPTHEVTGFLSTNVQTLLFPSDDTKEQRKKDNPRSSSEEVSYEIFTTKDSLKVGVKLLVAYRIRDPQLVLSILGRDGIIPHIENLATADMGKAIQQCSSQEFLSFYQTKPPKEDGASKLERALIDPPKAESFQDIVKNQLSKDLKEYGIELVRLNIETPKIMDNEIAKKMSEQSLKTAEANAQEAVLEKQYAIAKRQAEQEAKTKEIAQKQMNDAKISTAQADLDAAKLSAQALLVKADAERDAAIKRAEGDKKSADLKYDGTKLFELEMKKIEMDAVAKSNFLPVQMMSGMTPSMFMSPMSFFGGTQQRGIQQQNTANLDASENDKSKSSVLFFDRNQQQKNDQVKVEEKVAVVKKM